MNQAITTSVLIAGAVMAALVATLGLAGAVHITSQRERGYFHFVFYAIVFITAFISLVSGRDLTTTQLGFETQEILLGRNPLVAVIQPLLSLLVLTVSGERVITQWLRRDTRSLPSLTLLAAFVLFWIGTVAAPALFSAHPQLSHDFVYPLVIGMAAVLATGVERDTAIAATRNALLLLMLGGLILIPLQPGMVMDASYGQGLLPGVPRLAGLAPHAVSMGLLTQLGLACLLVSPLKHRWLNRLAWLVGLTVLVLAQSKTAWIAFILCTSCILLIGSGPAFWRRISDPKNPSFGVLAILLFMVGLVIAVTVFFMSDLSGRLDNFFATEQGAQIASLTGRDQIWAIAYDEWQRNPVFGFGPSLWGIDFRIAVNMPNATHAHNQFMDTLSRSGSIGAASLVIYAVVLLVLSLQYTGRSKGLTLALFLSLFLRSISEVPLLLFGYGAELIGQVLLLTVIAGCAAEARLEGQRVAQRQRDTWSRQPEPFVAARYRP
jgi:O-antigen ligase